MLQSLKLKRSLTVVASQTNRGKSMIDEANIDISMTTRTAIHPS